VLPTLEHGRTALFRKGLGCTLVAPDMTEAEVRAQPFRPASAPPVLEAPWPLGEGAVESQRLDDGRRALIERHAAAIFGETSAASPRQNALALLVAERGHLVYERYGEGMSREQPQLGWSMTKTVTALIAGLMARDGKLELGAAVRLPQWLETDKHSIRWRQLLNMAPGLRWFEGYGGASDATEMLFSHANQGAFAADRPLDARPGKVFNYSTGFTNIAMLRMRQLLGGSHQAIYDYYQSRLFAPLGIRGGVIEPDASGTPVGGARGVLRPVDWLRLGQLVSARGSWNGQTLIAPAYIDFMRTPSPAAGEYGGFLWRHVTERIDADIRARLPEDLVFFAGHMGQFLIIVPSRELLVLRMGASHGEGEANRRAFALAADLSH
jgi:CubicO group peptidase (beta-lactamase class C family)